MSTAAFKIEKGIPVPPALNASGPKAPNMVALLALEIGDSFFVPGGKRANYGVVVNRAKKKTGHTYTLRTVEGGVRIWRIS